MFPHQIERKMTHHDVTQPAEASKPPLVAGNSRRRRAHIGVILKKMGGQLVQLVRDQEAEQSRAALDIALPRRQQQQQIDRGRKKLKPGNGQINEKTGKREEEEGRE